MQPEFLRCSTCSSCGCKTHPKLWQLTLTAGSVCGWPAALAGSLLGRLRVVYVVFEIEHFEDEQRLGPLGMVDLSAFSQAAGCTAQLHICIYGMWSRSAEESSAAGILAGLRAVGPFCTLSPSCSVEHLAEHSAALSQLQCAHCVVHPHPQAHIAQLPSISLLTLIHEERADDDEPMSCEWSALASPGVRRLGSGHDPLPGLVVRGCSGLAPHDTPWVLCIWADMGTVRGLPVSSFVEEAPGMHVWRNAAAAVLGVQPNDWLWQTN